MPYAKSMTGRNKSEKDSCRESVVDLRIHMNSDTFATLCRYSCRYSIFRGGKDPNCDTFPTPKGEVRPKILSHAQSG